MELPKWPRLLVTGTPVTKEQANEVLVRTTLPSTLRGHDPAWTIAVARVFGIDADDGRRLDPDSCEEVAARLGTLDLSHLDNRRVTSVWLGGSHGWCDWNGTIGCADYNIGEWPTVDELTAEWTLIASTFRFLDLRAQVTAEEDGGDPAAEWVIVRGRAIEVEPEERIADPIPLSEERMRLGLHRRAERGVSLTRLRTAVDQVARGRR